MMLDKCLMAVRHVFCMCRQLLYVGAGFSRSLRASLWTSRDFILKKQLKKKKTWCRMEPGLFAAVGNESSLQVFGDRQVSRRPGGREPEQVLSLGRLHFNYLHLFLSSCELRVH